MSAPPRTLAAAIQRSQALLTTLSRESGINAKMWRTRGPVENLRFGPKAPHSTMLTEAGLAMVVAFVAQAGCQICRSPATISTAEFYARQGVRFNRSSLAAWVQRAACYLRPLRDHILEQRRRSERLFAGKVTASVLGPRRGRTRIRQLWVYARDDQPWGESHRPIVGTNCVRTKIRDLRNR